MNTFNKASKITVTILLLALALSLGACSSSQNSVSPKDDSVTSSPISESETLPAAEQIHMEEFSVMEQERHLVIMK